MAIDHVPFRFNRRDPDEVLARMAELAVRRDGKAWMSFQPQIDDDDADLGAGSFGIFSGQGPVVPNATWVPGHERRRRTIATSVGLEHPAGKDAVDQLEAQGIALPPRWTVQQDHARRGLTFVVPDDEDHGIVVEFVVAAGCALTPLDVGDDWYALVSEQR